MTNVKEFFEKHGMLADDISPAKYLDEFRQQMKDGLAGNPKSLEMIPTFLPNMPALPKNKETLAIDAGGTNLRIAKVSFDAEGKTVISGLKKTSMPGREKEIDADEFFEFLAEEISQFDVEDVGFCFSFPAESMPDRDAKIILISKEVKVRNSQGKMLGQEINARLAKRGIAPKKITILNDTCAALLGGMLRAPEPEKTAVGLILGTGINACYCEEPENIGKIDNPFKMIINTECGCYEGFPMGDLDLELNALSDNPEKPKMEKMTSGFYLGKVAHKAIVAAAEEGLFSEGAAEDIKNMEQVETPTLSHFDEGAGRLRDVCKTEDDIKTMDAIIENITERASKMMSIELVGILMSCQLAKEGLCYIATEGTTFYKNERMKEKVQTYTKAYALYHGIRVEFSDARDCTLLGAAISALL